MNSFKHKIFSILLGEILSPPKFTIISFFLSVIFKLPSLSITPISPQYIMYPKKENKNSKKIKMSFKGIYDKKDLIKGLDLRFNYYSWSPWNKEQNSSYLMEEIKDTLILWFPGNEFFKLDLKEKENFEVPTLPIT